MNRSESGKIAIKLAHKTIKKYSPYIASARTIYNIAYKDGDLTFDQFFELSQMNCFYCNSVPNNLSNCYLGRIKNKLEDLKWVKEIKETGTFIYNGLDRIDNNKPHNLDNCLPCCKWCNLSKSNMTVLEFIECVQNVR